MGICWLGIEISAVDSPYLSKDIKGGHCRTQQPHRGEIPDEVEFHSACESVQVRRPLEEAARMLVLVPTDVCPGGKVKMMTTVVPTCMCPRRPSKTLFLDFIILTVPIRRLTNQGRESGGRCPVSLGRSHSILSCSHQSGLQQLPVTLYPSWSPHGRVWSSWKPQANELK